MSEIHVVKRDGTREPFDANKINLALVEASEGLPDQIQKVVQVASEVRLTLFDGITTQQLDESVMHAALQNVKDDPDFDKIAARLMLKNVYKNILGQYKDAAELKKLHETKFADYLKQGIKDGLLDERMSSKVFDLKKLGKSLAAARKCSGVIDVFWRGKSPCLTHTRIPSCSSTANGSPLPAAKPCPCTTPPPAK